MNAAERKADAIRKADEIVAAAKAASREMTPDETTQVDALMDQADAAQGEIEQAEASRRAAGRLEAARASAAASTRRVPPAPIAAAPAAKVTDNFENDPTVGFKTPRAFMHVVMEAGKGRVAAVKDPRMQFLAAAGSDEQGEYSDQFGGFLVPPAYQPGLLKRDSMDPAAAAVAAATRKVPMTSPVVKVNARVDNSHSTSVSGGLRVYRRAEADTVTASRMQFEQIELQATSLFGIAYATEEILTDSPESFAALIADGFGEEFEATKLEERLNGLGGGEFLGINNATGLISITKETGQPATTLVYQNVLKAWARCWRPQMWLANQTTIPQLAQMSLSVGTGGAPVWMPSAVPGMPGTLLGLPIYFTERCAALGTAGDIICCNWNEYLEGSMGPTGAEESVHVRFVNHERCFKFYQRNAGAPWWSAALTPKNGDTLFPFVRVATRS